MAKPWKVFECRLEYEEKIVLEAQKCTRDFFVEFKTRPQNEGLLLGRIMKEADRLWGRMQTAYPVFSDCDRKRIRLSIISDEKEVINPETCIKLSVCEMAIVKNY